MSASTTSGLISPELVALDADLGPEKIDVIHALAQKVTDVGRASSADGLVADALAREAQAATGLPGGIGIPHCRSTSVTAPTLAFARLSPKVDFGAPDGPADLVFLIAAPEGGGSEHLTLLTALARALVRPAFTASLREAETPQDLVQLVQDVVAPAQKVRASSGAGATAAGADNGAAASASAGTATLDKASAAPQQPAGGTSSGRTIVAVTACPTGIAHTYMAADSLVAAGERAGVPVIVETQGSSGSTPLEASVIASASAVIFATEVGVKNRERFAGKPVVASGVKRAINEPDTMVAEAIAAADDPNSAKVEGSASTEKSASSGASDVSFGVKLRQVLLTGVSYMIPFVAAGGLLIALGFLLAGYEVTDVADDIVINNTLTNLPDGGLAQYIGAVLFKLGALAFGFLVPALAGYIAYGIADRPGIAPGFTAGAIAVFVGAGSSAAWSAVCSPESRRCTSARSTCRSGPAA